MRNRELNIQIGMRIQNCRICSGKTQEEVAEYLGLSPKSVSNIETGYTMCKPVYLIMLSEYFGVSIDYMLKGCRNDKGVTEI